MLTALLAAVSVPETLFVTDAQADGAAIACVVDGGPDTIPVLMSSAELLSGGKDAPEARLVVTASARVALAAVASGVRVLVPAKTEAADFVKALCGARSRSIVSDPNTAEERVAQALTFDPASSLPW